MTKWKYFTKKELACKHCSECEMDEEFMEYLVKAREISKVKYSISSGYRCNAHDKNVGGKGNHTTGRAVDITFFNGENAFNILYGLIQAGFQRIGISFSGKFIHADMVEDKPSPSFWGY